MVEKILPLKTPVINGLLFYAYPLAILSNDEDYVHWFYSNFIQLCLYKNANINIAECTFFAPAHVNQGIPLLSYQFFYKSLLFDVITDIDSFIIKCIDQGYYFYTLLDEFFVPQRWAYQKIHFTHDNLIYGYNKDDRYYSIIGFDHQQLYKPTKIGFDELNQAIRNDEHIVLLKRNEKVKYEFDLILVSELLEDYLYSRNSSERLRVYGYNKLWFQDCVWGMDIYKYLENYFQTLLEDESAFDIHILHTLHILWEHKRCMLLRIKYMQENNYLDSSSEIYHGYSNMEQTTLSLRNSMLKYQITRESKIVVNIIQSLKKMMASEQKLVSIMLDEISKRKYKIHT